LTHFDGRLWNTLPRLIFRPGKLTLEYLEGHRASQLPPFRMFLIVLLLVFFAGGLSVDQNHTDFKLADPNNPQITNAMSPKDKAEFEKSMAEARADLSANPLTAAAEAAAARTAAANAAAGKPASGNNVNLTLGDGSAKPSKRAAWLSDRVQKAIKNPEPFFVAMEQWGHRFAILMLPIAALMLSVLFAFKKGVYVFDHVIFSMHSLSFLGLLLSAIFLASIWAGAAWWLILLAPVHLFLHMRGTYRIGAFSALVRMWLLFLGTTVAVAVLGVGLVVVGLATFR